MRTRIAPQNGEITEITVEIAPPKKSVAWRESINLKLHVLQMECEDGYFQAFVPAFTISVITRKKAEFAEKFGKFQTEQRIYIFDKMQVKDLTLKKTFSLENIDLQEVFGQANVGNLNKLAESLIE